MLNAQGATPEQNNRLPKESRCGYDELTNSQNGNRSRYTSGIFLSQIYTSLGEHCPKSIEFAIRSIRGNKARNRTNNTSLFCEVVEAVSLPIHLGDTFHKFTKTQNTMKKPISNVILYLQNGTTFVCAQGVSLERAEEIKAHIETNPNEFSYRDVSRVEIQTLEGGEND